ncbi:MAG: hypothetical protein GEU83_18030 [Pseudonocardiaceae bacterium]|nr:hypothetical protein [Pseudonocardiaceae bacterium]
MDPDERVRFLGHLKLLRVAEDFLALVRHDGDLRAAWPLVDPDFRHCLAQQWLIDNRQDLDAEGFDRDQVAAAFAEEEPDHPLWHHFERVHLREWNRAIPSPDVSGIGANTRLVAPDVEVLYVHDTSDMEDGQWLRGEQRRAFPALMRWDGQRWRVLNLGSESVPQPGWPPTLT